MKMTKTEEMKGILTDPNTGEILCGIDSTNKVTITKHYDEENFIKVYYDTYIASVGANKSPLSPFLMELGKRMSYSSKGQIVTLIKPVKEEIADSLGISLTRVEHMIKECVDLGLIIRTGRGVYAVSPFIMSKGDWAEVKALQLTYNKALETLNIEAPLPSYLQEAKKSSWELQQPKGVKENEEE